MPARYSGGLFSCLAHRYSNPPSATSIKVKKKRPLSYSGSIFICGGESNPPLLQFMKGECHEKPIKHTNQPGATPISQK
jgi:hypothetical protein